MLDRLEISWVRADKSQVKSCYVEEVILAELKTHFNIKEIDLNQRIRGEENIFLQVEDSANLIIDHVPPDFKPKFIWCHDFYLRNLKKMYLLVSLLEQAEVLFFSSKRNLEEARNYFNKANKKFPKSFYLPYPVVINDCLPEKEKIIATAANVIVEDRMHVFLPVYSRFQDRFKLQWLIDQSEFEAATLLLNEFGITNYKLEIGRNPSNWKKLLEKALIALHLRFSAYGDFGPYLSISLIAGVGIIASDFIEVSDLPDSVLIKILCDQNEMENIALALDNLIKSCDNYSSNSVRYATEAYDYRFLAAEIFVTVHGEVKNNC